MRPLKRKRWVLILPGLVLVLLLGLWLCVPIWFPWILGPLAKHFGVHYDDFLRQGYHRFELHGASITNGGVVITAETVNALIPSTWFWRAKAVHGDSPQPFVTLTNWTLDILDTPHSSTVQKSTFTNLTEITRTLASLQDWLPSASLVDGRIQCRHRTLLVPALNWSNGLLTATARTVQPAHDFRVTAHLGKQTPSEIAVFSPSLQVAFKTLVSLTNSFLVCRGELDWHTNSLDLQATFGPAGLLPQIAHIKIAGFHLDAESAGLKGYMDATGSFGLDWKDGEFRARLSAEATPRATETNLPPLKAELRARGDTNLLVIESVHVSSPWISAVLSTNLELHFDAPVLRGPAYANLDIDLDRQSWFPLQGKLTGQANFFPSHSNSSIANFTLEGREIGNAVVQASRLSLHGEAEWPIVRIRRLETAFEDGSTAQLQAEVNLRTKSAKDGQLKFKGPLLNRWLDSRAHYANLELAASFHGPLTNLSHEASLQVTNLIVQHLPPIQLNADWKGQSLSQLEARGSLSLGESAIRLEGAFNGAAAAKELLLTSLSFQSRSNALLNLLKPARVSIRPGGQNWEIGVSDFVLRGEGSGLSAYGAVNWPFKGTVFARITNIDFALPSNFALQANPALHVDYLDTTAGWTNGPAVFQVSLAATANNLPPVLFNGVDSGRTNLNLDFGSTPISLRASLSGNMDGIVISNLSVSSRTSHLAFAQGRIPIVLNPGQQEPFQISANTRLDLKAQVEPRAFLWDAVAEKTGLRLTHPALSATLSGTFDAPRGEIDLSIPEIQFGPSKPGSPTITELDFQVQLDGQIARLTKGSFRIQGQPATLTAEMPLGREFWSGPATNRIRLWQRASGRLVVDDADLALFADFYPDLLAPQGRAKINLSFTSQAEVHGEIVVSGARTRPISDLGPLRDINLQLIFAGHTLQVEKANAFVGASPLSVTGSADLSGMEWLKGQLPPLRMNILATNVPLSRTPEATIRSDLNLVLTKTNGAPPLLTGTVRLGNSYFLSDLGALVGGKVAMPAQRPPFFSIEEPLLADWRLNLSVDGTRFLKVRSPIFNGEVSANLDLQGTLKDPVSVGTVEINSGTVRFPFASFEVKSGFVTLSRDRPYQPKLAITAASKQFGYDLLLQVTGWADSAVLHLTSNPPLSYEQILLMITTGELPREEQVLSTQQRAQTFALFLGRELLSKFGLGDTAEQRLIIQSGEQITQQGTPTYRIEYKFSDRWSALGEYDRFNDYNLGLKWRVYSK